MIVKEKEKISDDLQNILNSPNYSDNSGSKTSGLNSGVASAVMNIGIGSLLELAADMKDGEISRYFGYVNSLLEIIGPVIEQNGGRLIGIESDSGFTAVFDDCGSALKSAVTMCQYTSVGKDRGKNGFDFSGLTIGITRGAVYSGKVGYGNFQTPLVISECTKFAEFLRSVTEKYNSRILISESAADGIPDLSGSYNVRRLGKFVSQKNGNYNNEFIYDVFDGDSIDIKTAKRRGKLFFETGVNMFLERKYDAARSYFIELIKSYRNDSAAKEYFLLCDKCLSGEEPEGRNYLEIW